MDAVDLLGEAYEQPPVVVAEELRDARLVREAQGGAEVFLEAGVDLAQVGEVVLVERGEPEEVRGHAYGVERGRECDGARKGHVLRARERAPVAEEADVQFALPPARYVSGYGGDGGGELAHLFLVGRCCPVDDVVDACLVDRRSGLALVRVELRDGVDHLLAWVVELERRLHRERLYAGVFTEDAVHVHGGEVPPEGRRACADDGVERDAQFALEAVQPGEGGLEHQFGADDAVVQRRVAPGEEDALVLDLPSLQVFADDVVHRHHLLPLLEERDDADVLGVEVAYPVADGASVRQMPALLPGDELRVVVPHLHYLRGVGSEGKDDFLDGGFEVALVELVRDVVGDGDAVERFDEEFAHLQFDGGIRDAEGDDGVAPQFHLFGEIAGIVTDQFLDDVRVGVLALGVPHLLVASERQHIGGFDDLSVALDNAIDGVGGGLRVVRVLGAHYSRDQGHGMNLLGVTGMIPA